MSKPATTLPSLRRQLVWTWLGLGIVTVVLSGVLVSFLIYMELRDQTLQRAEHIAKLLQTNIESLSDLDALQRLVTSASAGQDVEHIVVVSNQPSTVLAANRLKWTTHPLANLDNPHLRDELTTTLQKRLVQQHISVDTVGYTMPVLLNRVLQQEALHWGAVTIHLHTVGLYQRALVNGLQSAAAIFLVIALYFFLAFGRIRTLVLQPLQTLYNALNAMEHNNQVEIPATDMRSLEFAGLSQHLREAFNALASKQAELARLAMIVQSTDQGVIIMDAEGRIEWINKGMEGISAYHLQEVQGKTLKEALRGASAKSLQRISDAIQQGQAIEQELYHQPRLGQGVWLDCRIQAVKDNNRVKYFFAIARNINEQKTMQAVLAEERALLTQRVEERTQELTAANRELEKLSELKSQFIASMSHELRTPLNAILGFSGSLLEQRHGELNTYQQRSVSHIETSGRHLLEVINDILDLSKIEAGKFELRKGRVSLQEVGLSSLAFIRPQAEQQQLQVHLDIAESLTWIDADERRLRQILINLLSNAVKFTPPNGSIGLEIYPHNEDIVFCVWDTGIGIDEANQTYLFLPFYQLDSSLTRSHDGTGLGLLLSSQFAKLHGGHISLESVVGQGSRFYVHLPRHLANATDA
jgi:PAS domain S-box-containing protein